MTRLTRSKFFPLSFLIPTVGTFLPPGGDISHHVRQNHNYFLIATDFADVFTSINNNLILKTHFNSSWCKNGIFCCIVGVFPNVEAKRQPSLSSGVCRVCNSSDVYFKIYLSTPGPDYHLFQSGFEMLILCLTPPGGQFTACTSHR